MYDWFKII